MNVHNNASQVITIESPWRAFGPCAADEPLPDLQQMAQADDTLNVNGRVLRAQYIEPVLGQHDFTPMLGPRYGEHTWGQIVYVLIHVQAQTAGRCMLGLGGDYRVEAWMNGVKVLAGGEAPTWPPSFKDHRLEVGLTEGRNTLAIRLTSGKGSALLAVGGPADVAREHFHSILTDPFMTDPRWQRHAPQATISAASGSQDVIPLGTRRELLVDSFLVESTSGDICRRLHPPVPAQPVFMAEKPWEETGVNYFSLVPQPDSQRVLLYYSARPRNRRRLQGQALDQSIDQYTCVLQSHDGIHFQRPELGLIEYEGSTANNIIWQGTPAHNFSPFLDANPDAAPDERFKAIAYHPQGKALGVFASADGLQWRLLCENKVITRGTFDSHNLAFWDVNIGQYVCYYRDNIGGLRRVFRATSDDFKQWSAGQELTYADDRIEHLYTNGILNYAHAPHLYMGLANRFVPERTKVATHPYNGLNDTILMTSRDGRHFDRHEEGYLRPNLDWQNWTDRNHYICWGMMPTSPREISIYWTEHHRHPGMRLVRGTIRRDGFASLHAGAGNIGEVLTRPFTFKGQHLTLNYASSVIGSIRVGICQPDGQPIAGYSMRDCEVLYGNELDHVVHWRGSPDLTRFENQPIRLRLRLHDADWYALQFR